MSLQSVLASGRAAAEARMMSAGTSCVITRPGTTETRDAAGFRNTAPVTPYSGPCEVADGGVRRITVGGTVSDQATKILKLPAGTAGLKDGDVAALAGGDVDGISLRLLEVTPSNFKTALRIPCVEA